MSMKRIRHDRNHWQQLVEKQTPSGLSGAQFCRQQKIAYAGFMSWRKQLQHSGTQCDSESPNTFVELTAPRQISQTPLTPTTTETNLCVELSLGDGIELRVSQRA